MTARHSLTEKANILSSSLGLFTTTKVILLKGFELSKTSEVTFLNILVCHLMRAFREQRPVRYTL